MVKIIFRLTKRLSPPANDELNSTLEVQHGVGHQFSPNSFQNQKFSDSNEIQSLKEKIEAAINERLLTVPVPPKKGQSLENVVENQISFFEDEVVRVGNAAAGLTSSVQQHHPAQYPKGRFLPLIRCVSKLGPG